MKNKIRIKYFDPELKMIMPPSRDGEWIDLRSAEDVTMMPGDFRVIRLGVAIELPEGYEAIIAMRSSSYKKWGIIQTNGIGVIDNAYCGDNDEWMVPVMALRQTKIHKNDRICQFRIIYQQPHFDIEAVKSLGNGNRGGFGSTGKD